MAEREIVVEGSAEHYVLPDRGTLRVTLEGTGPNSDVAYQAAASTAARVDDIVDQFRPAIDRTTVTALLVTQEREWRKDRWIQLGWKAERRSRLELTDLTQIGPLIGRLSTLEDVSVDGPTWAVDPANEGYDEVRTAAARDARRRATAYAAGLGLSVGAVVRANEPGLSQAPSVMPQAAGMFQAEASMGIEMEVAVDEIAIRASVEVTFELADGR